MTIRRRVDHSLTAIYVCRHTQPATSAFVSSTDLCPEHNGIPDCLMRFTALSWLQETANRESKRVWDSRRGQYREDRRDSMLVAVQACRYSESDVTLRNSCNEHDGNCTDVFVAASFLAGYAATKELWRTLQTELAHARLPVLLGFSAS